MKIILNRKIILFLLFITTNLFASLSNHPASFSEMVNKGDSITVELHISNSIASPLSYSFNITENWIRIFPASSSVGGNETITVLLTFDATNLNEGVYSTEITLNDPHHGGLQIPVQLTVTSTTGIEKEDETPNSFLLIQNYPNPFNPSTTISFSLPKDQNVSLIVYNVLGNQIQTLINKYLPLGNYSLKFDAANLPSGIYFYRIQSEQFSQVKKMILTKLGNTNENNN